jgi:excisionase family DNA binding protein
MVVSYPQKCPNCAHPLAPLEGPLDYPQAAQFLNLSESYLRKLVWKGALRPIKVGRRVLFDPADLRKWLAAQKRGPSLRER